MYLTKERAKDLLQKGNTLTASGKNLDTLEKTGSNEFSWKGLFDQDSTCLNWEQAKLLISNRDWSINL